jgi:hypothetical protein
MVKVEIDVDQVLTSAVALEVEPGDRLLVMNGVVIGMIEKRGPRHDAEVQPAPPPPKPNGTYQTTERGRLSAFDTGATNRIIELLRQRPMTAQALATQLRIESGNPALNVRDLMVSLRHRQMIEAIDTDKRRPRYRAV